MPKHPRADIHSEPINVVFERLFAIANTSKPADDVTLSILKKLKQQVLSAATEEEEVIRKAAREFTLDEVVKDFGLTYSPELKESSKYRWKIEVLPDVKTFQPSSCFGEVSP
jgi:predicted RNase H-like nuclease